MKALGTDKKRKAQDSDEDSDENSKESDNWDGSS